MYSKDILISPLLGAWEFTQRPKRSTTHWENEWEILAEIMRQNSWKTSLDLKKIVRNQEHTLVVTTDRNQICYTNRNFERMTGYSFLEAKGKKPSFLQGKETRSESVLTLRHAIQNKLRTTTSILNYRKNGEIYHCKIDLHPIYNKFDELINFLAIEQEAAESI